MPSLDLFDSVISLVPFSQGDVIFREGDTGEAMYLLKQGHVEIRTTEASVATLQPGDLFGEMALISREPRSATAVAKTDCQLLPVDEEKFLFLVQQTPYFALHVMGILAERLRTKIG